MAVTRAGAGAITLKKLKIKPKKAQGTAPCLSEMATLLNCWSSLSIEDVKCRESAKNLTLCMAKPFKSNKVKDETNFHLARLGKDFLK